MELMLTLQEIQAFTEIEDDFYSEDEKKLTSGELQSSSHEEVMDKLKKALAL